MNKRISKVVVYFTDGTYQELSNSYPLTPGAPYPNYPAPPGPINPINPMNPIPYNPPTTWSGTGCKVCGLGADGKPTGYVCPRMDCPTKMTCKVTDISIPKWGWSGSMPSDWSSAGTDIKKHNAGTGKN